MKIAIISGSGFYEFAELKQGRQAVEKTKYGEASFEVYEYCGHTVFFLARHGKGHPKLPNHINHRANIRALKEAGAECVFATAAAGILDPALEPGRPMVFDDLYFPENRLPDGSVCTFFDAPGAKDRGHLIMAAPFSESLRKAAIRSAKKAGTDPYESGTYVYSTGPRFNTKSEIRMFSGLGTGMVGQTAGPEAVLSGELEMPYCLIGFGVDYANGVKRDPTPVEVLNSNLEKSGRAFKDIIINILGSLKEASFDNGFVYRFE